MIDEMRAEAQSAINLFPSNRVLTAIAENTWTKDDYERLLLTIFHQVYRGTMSFALAASNCPAKWTRLREYLISHTSEEMRHYEWIVDDLASIGYSGPAPQETMPSAAALSYISFNVYNATYFPPSRLCSSTVLEGLAAHIDPNAYMAMLDQTGLKPENFSFFLRHAETDKHHITELWDVVEDLDLTEAEWKWMKHATNVAGGFYRRMYDESVIAQPIKNAEDRQRGLG